MPKTRDISGKRFNRLTAIRKCLSRGKRVYWEFKCDCGTIKEILSYSVTSGSVLSCGCINSLVHSIVAIENNKLKITHGMTLTPTYNVWSAMKKRCYKANHKAYKDYGGRGITVCDRWLNSFENFLEDMGEQPKGLQIDRVNNNGNYEPSNCRWVTPKENCANRIR